MWKSHYPWTENSNKCIHPLIQKSICCLHQSLSPPPVTRVIPCTPTVHHHFQSRDLWAVAYTVAWSSHIQWRSQDSGKGGTSALLGAKSPTSKKAVNKASFAHSRIFQFLNDFGKPHDRSQPEYGGPPTPWLRQATPVIYTLSAQSLAHSTPIYNS